MENVVLIVHLLLALSLIGIVLMQRSEGGGLGMGGGGNATTGRAGATPLGKVTWILAIAFIGTSLTLTIFAAENATGSSVLDRIGGSGDGGTVEQPGTGAPQLPDTDSLLPPPAGSDDAPLVPRAE